MLIARHSLHPRAAEIVVFEMKRDLHGVLIGLEALDSHEQSTEQEVRSPLVEAFVVGFLGSASLLDD